MCINNFNILYRFISPVFGVFVHGSKQDSFKYLSMNRLMFKKQQKKTLLKIKGCSFNSTLAIGGKPISRAK
jgi:hypothetical protein